MSSESSNSINSINNISINNNNPYYNQDQEMNEAAVSVPVVDGNQVEVTNSPPSTTMDSTMFLSHAEYDLAMSIREAVEKSEHLVNLTDMEYVQYALTCAEETMESICQRIQVMQAFRQEYTIQDSVDEGIQLFHDFTVQQPGFVLTVDYLRSSQNYIEIRDMAAWFPGRAKTQADFRVMLGGTYYSLQCRNPNFTAMRNGMTSMNECMGVTLENVSFELMEKPLHQLLRPYPKNQREAFFLNSPDICNVFFGLWKRFLPEKIFKSFQMGHQILGMEGQRIDSLYKMPTAEIARQNVLRRVYSYLQLRYHNQATFTLANCVRY